MQYLGYHNHNFFCDGEGSLEEYAKSAVKQGVKHLGFSSHAPFIFLNKWSIKQENINKYIEKIRYINKNFHPVLTVYAALEIDFLPGKIHPFDFFRENYELDYTIGSVHYVQHPQSGDLLFIDGPGDAFLRNLYKIFGGDIQRAVRLYFTQTREMISTQKPDILGHMDKIIKNANDLVTTGGRYPSWYMEEVEHTLDAVAEYGTILELNLRGLNKGSRHTFFPDEAFISPALQRGIRFVISADAHKPEEVGMNYKEALHRFKRAGGRRLTKLENNQWIEYSIND